MADFLHFRTPRFEIHSQKFQQGAPPAGWSMEMKRAMSGFSTREHPRSQKMEQSRYWLQSIGQRSRSTMRLPDTDSRKTTRLESEAVYTAQSQASLSRSISMLDRSSHHLNERCMLLRISREGPLLPVVAHIRKTLEFLKLLQASSIAPPSRLQATGSTSAQCAI